MNLAFADPGWLLALPLALLPLWRRDADTVRYSWLALVPADPLSTVVGWLLRLLAVAVLAAIVAGLAGLHRPQVPVERVGRGAEIVLLLDRSRSMDEPLKSRVRIPAFLGGGADTGPLESKGMLARRLLAEFAAGRPTDLVGLVLFSASAIPVLGFTQKAEMIQAAIAAGGIGQGLSETNVGRGLLSAAAYYEGREYAGSRLVLMVSDGAAQIDEFTRERIRTAFKRQRLALYWIYIRSSSAPGLHPAAPEAAPQSPAPAPSPEHALHEFFGQLGVPYRAYEAEDPDALKRAIADVGRLENLPVQYRELLPRVDLAGRCYAFAAGACLLLFAAALLRARSWA